MNLKLIHAAGDADAQVETLKLFEIDRSSRIDITTSLFLPALGKLSSFEELQNIIAHLRSPEGCPWDREQTHKSLRPFLIEEAYEVLESLDADDPNALYQEMGDLLLQILLHTQIAIDAGEFYMSDVLQHLNKKMIHRIRMSGEMYPPRVISASYRGSGKQPRRRSVTEPVCSASPFLTASRMARRRFSWRSATPRARRKSASTGRT